MRVLSDDQQRRLLERLVTRRSGVPNVFEAWLLRWLLRSVTARKVRTV